MTRTRRQSMTLAIALLLGLILSLGSSPALCDTLSPEKRAEMLYAAAQKAEQRDDFKTALSFFRESYQAYPTRVAKRAVVVMQLHLAQHLDAHTSLLEYQAEYGEKLTDAQKAEVETLRRDLDKKLTRLDLVVHPPHAVVQIDGAVSPNRVWVAPGIHRLTVTAPEHYTEKKELLAVAGRHASLEITLRHDPQRTVGKLMTGLGASGVAVGAILGAHWLDHKIQIDNKIRSLLDEPVDERPALLRAMRPELNRLAKEGTDLAGAAITPFLTGLVTVGIGLHLLISDSGTSDPGTSVTVRAPRLAVVPASGGAVVMVGGAWQ